MAQRTIWLAGIGELTLSKRRGTKNIRLSVSASGQVRVGLPAWAPYSTGISFALSRKDWILKQLAKHDDVVIHNRDRIGKSYRIKFVSESSTDSVSTRIVGTDIIIRSGRPIDDTEVQRKVKAAAERALRKEAEKLLPARLSELARRHGFRYRSVKIKKLTSRWGSCSSDKVITLNFFLMQLPWQHIDYVLLHELIHTKHLNHSPDFWLEFDGFMPGAKRLRREIRQYRPAINGVSPSVA